MKEKGTKYHHARWKLGSKSLWLVCIVLLLICHVGHVYAEEDVLLTLTDRNAEDNTVFAVKNMFPGDRVRGSYCVNVNVKRLPADEQLILRFKANTKSNGEKLAEVLKCTVSLKENGTVLYDGLMKDMPQSIDYRFTAGIGSKEVVYEITAYLDSSVGNAYMGQKLNADFRWWLEYEECLEETIESSKDETGQEEESTEDIKKEHGTDISVESVAAGDDNTLRIWMLLMMITIMCGILGIGAQLKRKRLYNRGKEK